MELEKLTNDDLKEIRRKRAHMQSQARVRLRDEEEDEVERMEIYREEIIERFRAQGLRFNENRIYMNLDRKTLNAHKNKLSLEMRLTFHESEPQRMQVQAVHPIYGDVIEEDGTPVLRDADIFTTPPTVALTIDTRLDLQTWEWGIRMRVNDLRNGPEGAREPVFQHEMNCKQLGDVFNDGSFAALQSTIEDRVPAHARG